MSYISLYRKYRPVNFDQVVSQEHVVKTLTNQIQNDRVSHAYLFCGTRGTGKTSIAKIFARAVNCMDLKDGNPCNECKICKTILNDAGMNVIEIDAASNNGVDNIREIRTEVKYAPTTGKYKVYIIDEVHMLSKGAFNALLKTLEEPPEHVIFILATTDPQKIPATIHSRCQRFDFKRINKDKIAAALGKYMEIENIEIEEKALRYISKLADGAMRDALSILEQTISFHYGEKITYEKLLDVLGAVDNKVFFDFVELIVKKDAKGLLEFVEKISNQGRDFRIFIEDLIEHLRNILVVMSTGDYENVVEIEKEYIQVLREHAKNLGVDGILKLINVFSELEMKMKNSSQKRILFEVESLKLMKPTFNAKISSDVAEKLKNLECRLENMNTLKCKTKDDSSEVKKKKEVRKKPKAVPEEVKKMVMLWNEIKMELSTPLQALLEDAEAGYLEDEILYIVCENTLMENVVKGKIQEIQDVLSDRIDRDFDVRTILAEDFCVRYREFYGLKEEGSKDYDENIEKIIRKFKDLGVDVQVN